MQRRDEDANAVRASWRVVYTVWLAELAVVVAIWMGVPFAVPRGESEASGASLIAWIFYGIGLGDVALGWWFKERALAASRGSTAAEAMGRLLGPSMVAVTLAMTPALLGLGLYLVFGYRLGFSVLCALSVAGFWLSRPRLEHWQEMVDANRSP